MPLCVLLYLYCTIFYPAFGCHIPIKRIVLYFLKPSAEGCPTARPDCSRPRQGFVRYFCDGILMHYEGLTCDVVVEAAVTLAWRDSAHKRRQVSCVIWPTICAPLGRGVLPSPFPCSHAEYSHRPKSTPAHSDAIGPSP